MTQRDLELALALPPTTISHIEACRRIPDPALRQQLANELGVDVAALFPPHVLVVRDGARR